ncbi:MAG: hypothetical protein JWL96_4262 [Sphingomonas bacterium]|uniref:DUF6916 family protein n=1 Tax=Sphingomonas bacterium TaxID=1895847 RepID=UPI00262871BA|nr:hypothetical protein [Sphingomonas bacterium]MDB5712192.1 hypothetical protein [Sphingomonas bacterium]
MSDNDEGSVSVATLTAEDFKPHIGTVFIAGHGDFEDQLTLVEVIPALRPATQGFRQPFTLVLDGIRDDAMINNMIEIEHPVMGAQLLTPSATGRNSIGGFRYELVFG